MSIAGVLRAPAPRRGGVDAADATLSVLIPAFNAASTIGEALESVLLQVPAPHEVVVSDDGSEDDLAAALRPFGSRIAIVRGPNAGLATARNRAAAASTGSLLGLLDADDVWLPGRAAAFLEAARLRPDLDVVTTDAWVVEDGRRDDQTYYGRRTWSSEDQVDAILRASFIFGAACIRRAAFERVGGYRPGARFAEDWDLWLRLLVSGSSAGLVAVPLYEYRRRPGSLTRRKVELAVGAADVLARARTLPLTARQRGVLRATEGSWRVKAADAARSTGAAERRRLALRAIRARTVPARDRLRLAARLLS